MSRRPALVGSFDFGSELVDVLIAEGRHDESFRVDSEPKMRTYPTLHVTTLHIENHAQ
jgi:hypothetical protein